jgi:hypothetical protein
MNKSEFLNKLVKENGLDLEQDLWALPFKGDGGKSKHIVTKTGVEKIQYNNNIEVRFEVVASEPDWIVVKAIATMGDVKMETYGEASAKNTTQKYPFAMAEKRGLARVVLKACGASRYGVYGEDESEDFKRDK